MSANRGWKGAFPLVAIASIVACSTSRSDFVNDTPSLTPDAGEADAAVPPACGMRCSRDLHAVVDSCSEQVLETCPTDFGCAAGKCVPACESAAASQGSVGCSFWAVPPDVQDFGQTSCYAAFIANTWSTPVTVSAEFRGGPLDVSKSIYRASTKDGGIAYEPFDGAIPPGEVGIVFLAQGKQSDAKYPDDWIGCPAGVNVAHRGNVIEDHKTSIYDAFHLSTDVPVSAYSIFPYGGARSYVPSATLLLPSSSWGTNYVLVDGYASSYSFSFVQIVAQEDDTEVRMRPAVDVKDSTDTVSGSVVGGPKGFVWTQTLKRGQVLELAQDDSLAGTPIETSRPVAVFGGTQCVDIPSGKAACDSLQQQMPSIQQWASAYSAVPYESRRAEVLPRPTESVMWKVVGAREGTILTYEPAPPKNAPTTLGSGQTVTFDSDVPFTVKSQGNEYPFYLSVFMTGSTVYGTHGDPDFVNVIPDEQFLDHYVFFVDYTYADSNLTVIRRKDANGFHDVTLDCLGAVTEWKPLGTDGSTEYAWVEVTSSRAPVGNCSYGRHEASSDGPFGLYVWGLDKDASYGFPAGAGSRPISPYTISIH